MQQHMEAQQQTKTGIIIIITGNTIIIIIRLLLLYTKHIVLSSLPYFYHKLKKETGTD